LSGTCTRKAVAFLKNAEKKKKKQKAQSPGFLSEMVKALKT